MDRARSLAAPLAAATILGVLAGPMLGGRIYAGDDLGWFALPLRWFYARCLAGGDDFRWCPQLYCGFDLHGEGQVGMLHPFHLLLYRLVPLRAAFDVECLASYPALFAGMALLLRRWGLPRDAAGFGALSFTFSGFNLVHFMHMNALEIVAHVPWLLLAADVILREADPRRVAWGKFGMVLLTASQLLLGYPQYVWFSALAEATYTLVLVHALGGRGRLAALVEAKALGILAGGAQLIPTWDLLGRSVRASPTADFVALGSMHPANLVQLLAPYLFRDRHYLGPGSSRLATHELTLYDGATAPVLMTWLLVRRRFLGRSGRLAAIALGLGGVAIVLALGRFSPFFEVWRQLPLVSLFRFSSRHVVLVHLALAILGAIALADLGGIGDGGGRMPWRALWPIALPMAMSLWIAAGAIGLAGARPGGRVAEATATTALVLTGPALVGMATALVLAAARGVRIALVGIVLLAATDQAIYGLTYVWRDPPVEMAELLGTRRVPQGAAGRRVQAPWGDNLWIMEGVSLVDGYSGLIPRRGLHYAYRDPLRLAGARWVIWDVAAGDWLPVPDPLPRARLVPRAVKQPFPGGVLDRYDLRTTALVPVELGLPGGEPGEAKIRSDRPGSIEIATKAGTRQLLVLAESYHEGWRVAVDGRPCPVVRAYDDFLGCVVEPGGHTVAFRFAPRSYRVGAWCSAVGMAAALVSLAWTLSRGRGRGTGPEA